jgi:hypothetical protein
MLATRFKRILANAGSLFKQILVTAVRRLLTLVALGFDNLVDASQAYYKTAIKELWTHPYHQADADTFGKEFQCWFGKMATTKCGGLPSQADARKDDLTKMCQAHDTEWMNIWKKFSAEEVAWFKKEYPAEPTEGDGRTVSMSNAESDGVVNYKEAMTTAKEVSPYSQKGSIQTGFSYFMVV